MNVATSGLDVPSASPSSDLSIKTTTVDEKLQATPSTSSKIEEAVEGGETTIASREGFPAWKWSLCLVSFFLTGFLYGLDTTVTASVQVSIYNSFGQVEKIPWIGLSFPMASSSMSLLTTRLLSKFNIKWVFIGGMVVFEGGSALCGGAPSMDALIVGRVLGGIGASAMYLGALTYVSVFEYPTRQPLSNTLLVAFWAIGAIIGPVLGGSLAKSDASWRWAFYVNLPLFALFSPIYLFILPPFTYNQGPKLLDSIKQMDWLGGMLHAGSIVLFVTVLLFSGDGADHPWNSAFTIALFVFWGLFVGCYIMQQAFCFLTTPEENIFPKELLKSKTALLLIISTGATSCAYFITLYYVPIYFQFTRGDDSLKGAIRLFPLIVVYVVVSGVSGALMPRIKLYAAYYTLAGALMITGGSLMYTIDVNTSTANIYGYEVLIAAGVGLVFQAAYAILARKVEPTLKAKTIGFIMVGQIGTIPISLAIAGCLYHNVGFAKLKDAMNGFGISDVQLQAALGGEQSGVLARFSEEATQAAVASIADTISKLFALVISGGSVIFVSSLMMTWERLEFTDSKK